MIARIYLEVTSKCNYACIYCMHPTMTRAKRHMDWDLACRALEQIQQHQVGRDVYFNYLGESLLYPQLYDLIEVAHGLELRCHLITNGSLLNERNVARLAQARLASIKVSHDSSRETVSQVHGNRAFPASKILENVDRLLLAMTGSETEVGVVLMTTVAGHERGIDGVHLIANPDQLRWEVETLLRVAANHGATRGMEDLLPELDGLNWRWWNPKVYLRPGLFLEIRPVLNWANSGLSKGPVIPTDHGTCGALVDKMGILVNGDVVLCCVDYNGENVLGNITEKSLAEILDGHLARKVREGFARGEVVLDACKVCLGTVVPSVTGSTAVAQKS